MAELFFRAGRSGELLAAVLAVYHRVIAAGLRTGWGNVVFRYRLGGSMLVYVQRRSQQGIVALGDRNGVPLVDIAGIVVINVSVAESRAIFKGVFADRRKRCGQRNENQVIQISEIRGADGRDAVLNHKLRHVDGEVGKAGMSFHDVIPQISLAGDRQPVIIGIEHTVVAVLFRILHGIPVVPDPDAFAGLRQRPRCVIAAEAVHVILLEPVVKPRGTVKNFAYAVALKPALRLFVVRHTYGNEIAVKVDKGQKVVVSEGLSSDQLHARGDRDFGKSCNRIPILIHASAELTALKGKGPDAFQALRQTDLPQIITPAEGVAADVRHTLGNLYPTDGPTFILPRGTQPELVVVIIVVHDAVTVDQDRIQRFMIGAGGVEVRRVLHSFIRFLIIPAGTFLIDLHAPGHVLTAVAGQVILRMPVFKPRRVVKDRAYALHFAPIGGFLFARQTDFCNIAHKIDGLQKVVVGKGLTGNIRNVIRDRDLGKTAYGIPALAVVSAGLAAFKGVGTDALQRRRQRNDAQVIVPAEGVVADMRHALGNVNTRNSIGREIPRRRNEIFTVEAVIVHGAFALNIERITDFFVRVAFSLVLRVCDDLPGVVIDPEAVLVVFLQPPGQVFAAVAVHAVIRKPGIKPRRVVKDLLHAPRRAPVFGFFLARQADDIDIAVKIDRCEHLVVCKRHSRDIRNVIRDRDLFKAADHVPVVAVALAALAAFKGKRADALQRCRQRNDAQVIVPAEGVVADMRHALGDVQTGDLPAHILPRHGFKEFFSDRVVLHRAFARNKERVVRFIMRIGLIEIFFVCDPFIGFVIIPPGIFVFFHAPGHILAAGAGHAVGSEPVVKPGRVVKDPAHALGNAPVGEFFPARQTDVCKVAFKIDGFKHPVVCESLTSDIRHTRRDRDLGKAVHGVPAIAFIPAVAAALKRECADRL